jgi:hypothetical protein
MLDADSWFAHAFYSDATHANAAVRQLLDAHFSSEAISVLMTHDTDVEELPIKHKTFVPHGVALGAVLGAAAGALTMSGIGIVATGPLWLALQGAAAGGAVGTLGGALGGLGFWRDEVDFPTDAFQDGAMLVGVVTNQERLEQARKVLAAAGAAETHVSTKAIAGRLLTDQHAKANANAAARGGGTSNRRHPPAH